GHRAASVPWTRRTARSATLRCTQAGWAVCHPAPRLAGMPRPVSPTRSTHRRLILAGLAASLVAVALAAPIAAAAGAADVVPTDDATPARHGAAERLALRLLNCTRTGGKVRADGTCKGYGSGRY